MSVSIIDQSTGNPTQVSGNANDKVGNLSALSTTDKSSAVGAINEVNSAVSTKQDKTDNNLTTSSKTIVGAINELKNILCDVNGATCLQCIELAPTSQSAGHGGFIDFHYNGSSSDYTSRIIEAESGNVTINGISITGLSNGLDNVMKVPDQDAVVLGYAAKNGPNNVIVSLGSNNILNYDFMEFMTAYYNSGVACYGYLIVPTCTMRYVFGGDTGVAMTTRNTVNTVGTIYVVLNHANNDVTFMPQDGIEPLGNYYVVRGVKLRK